MAKNQAADESVRHRHLAVGRRTTYAARRMGARLFQQQRCIGITRANHGRAPPVQHVLILRGKAMQKPKKVRQSISKAEIAPNGAQRQVAHPQGDEPGASTHPRCRYKLGTICDGAPQLRAGTRGLVLCPKVNRSNRVHLQQIIGRNEQLRDGVPRSSCTN